MKLVLLAAGVREEIGDDVVQAFGFAGDDLQQLAVFVAQVGDAGQHADRAGNRSQRIADLVGDGGRQAPHGGQAVLHADFALQTADFGEIVESVDVSRCVLRPGTEGVRHCDAKGFAEAVGSDEAHFSVGASESTVGSGSRKSWLTGWPRKSRSRALQQFLRGGVRQGDVTVQAGGDQPAADGLNDVLVQGLQVFQRAAGVLQL